MNVCFFQTPEFGGLLFSNPWNWGFAFFKPLNLGVCFFRTPSFKNFGGKLKNFQRNLKNFQRKCQYFGKVSISAKSVFWKSQYFGKVSIFDPSSLKKSGMYSGLKLEPKPKSKCQYSRVNLKLKSVFLSFFHLNTKAMRL